MRQLKRANSCEEADQTRRREVQRRLAALDVVCEEMCRKLGAYPNCQCPGFNGKPASEGDARDCYAKFCHPSCYSPDTPHDSGKSDMFMTCVQESTHVEALLSWDSIFSYLDKVRLPSAQSAKNGTSLLS